MKIINALTGKSHSIPFTLGQKGRGRWFEEIKISNRPGQAPTGSDDVGFFTFGGDEGWEGHCPSPHKDSKKPPHVILTHSQRGQEGILLVIETEGCYTRGASRGAKAVALLGGDAILLTAGTWAWGDAGSVGAQRDELWHVRNPSVFSVYLAGGSSKGYGLRYVIVTRSFRVLIMKRDELSQLVATDEDPEVTEVVRQFVEQLPSELQDAVRLAEQLEEMDDTNQVDVTHFNQWGSIEEVVKGYDLAIPAVMAGVVKGISGVQAGTLVPGDKPLVALEIGPGGGSRYRYEKVSETGLTRLKETCNHRCTRESVLAIADDSNWSSAWKEYKDGEVTAYVLANAGGVHSFTPNPEWGEPIRTQAWAGIAAVTPSEAEFRKIFGLEGGGSDFSDPTPEPPVEGWSINDLAAKFGRRR